MKSLFGIAGLLVIVIVVAGCGSVGSESVYSAADSVSSTTVAQQSASADTVETSSDEGDQAVGEETTSTTSTDVSDVETSPPGESGYDGPLASFVEMALSDLTGRLNISVAQIVVVSAEPMVWPNGALGCPQDDMMYTQVLVDGTVIVLSANGATYNYHSGGPQDPFLCVPSKTTSGKTSTTLDNNAGGGNEDN